MNYVDLAPIVGIDVMGAPQPLVIRKIAEAANEFFRLTRAYEVEHTPAAVSPSTQEVTLTPPLGTAFCELISARLGASRLWPRLDRQLEEEFGEWEAATGTPRYVRPRGAVVRLVPYPVEANPALLRLRYTVTPTLTAATMADDPGLTYQDALIDGAKARLLSMPKKDWTDLAQAEIFQSMYLKRLNEARLLARNGGISDVQIRVRPRFA